VRPSNKRERERGGGRSREGGRRMSGREGEKEGRKEGKKEEKDVEFVSNTDK
jgi:hypothetical protein